MNEAPPPELSQRLDAQKQQHLLFGWDDLDPTERASLVEQIEAVDFELNQRLLANADESSEQDTSQARAHCAKQPRDVVRLPRNAEDADERAKAARHGEELLAAGKVGVILVAGGQGTRLGFAHPKGMYQIGPVSGKTLFQVLIEKTLARSRRAGVTIPYYVMTSDATHEATLAFFNEHDYFGLDPESVHCFRQGNMPAADAATGKLLLEEMGRLALNPDGHGGMLAALRKAGCLNEMRDRGVEYLFYHQVDNPAAIVCDPVFLGFHALRESEMSTKVVAKLAAGERMGVVVDVDGETQIIEYSDMPQDVAALRDDSGELFHWAGNTAIHAFDRSFLERLTEDDLALPFHLSRKKVSFIDRSGSRVIPDGPNAYKFERFIFDALPRARRAVVVEADRFDEFHPVKNATGEDSPATAQAGMTAVFAGWLNQAGATFPPDVAIEISPLFALDADELKQKLKPGTVFDGPVYLS